MKKKKEKQNYHFVKEIKAVKMVIFVFLYFLFLHWGAKDIFRA